MRDRFAGARSVLVVGVVAVATTPTSFATTCNAAALERLVNPRVVTTADTYEVSMRRSLSSTERADALLLKDALRKSLAKDPAQVMELRGATYLPIVSCEGYRIVGMSVRKENVNFVAAPPVAVPAASASAPVAAPAAAPALAPSSSPSAAALDVPVAVAAPVGASLAEEAADRRELAPLELTPRELTPRELTPRELTPRELTPRDLTPRELSQRELTPRELSPVPQSVSQ